MQRVTTYISWEIAEGTRLLVEEIPHLHGIHGVLEVRGQTMTRLREEVTARMPRAEEARYLQIPSGVPVLDSLYTSVDQHGIAYVLTRFVLRADLGAL
ncbi:UTRA domain-containing protein [Cryptosporangium phraense]|uniref:UTRA domain-containing protein n=1 Tax=Cryptosporangium phraense TaxID=2593070 RepID=UPI0014788615|nr:UTRA domain-containing protein [Cryptosporangium phraense]